MRVLFMAMVAMLLQGSFLVHAKPLTEGNIRQYLKENPSIILDVLRANSVDVLGIVVEGSEKEARLEVSQQKMAMTKEFDAVKKKKAYPTLLENRPFLGAEKAPVQMVVYSDFLCPYCANSAEVMSALLAEQSNVRYIFKAYTRNPIGQTAYAYFLALWQKHGKEAFALYDTLFANQERLAKEKEAFLLKTIKEMGYNVEEIQTIAKSPAIKNIIKQDMDEGTALKLKGTPTTVINGKYVIVGAVPLELINYAREYAQKNP